MLVLIAAIGFWKWNFFPRPKRWEEIYRTVGDEGDSILTPTIVNPELIFKYDILRVPISLLEAGFDPYVGRIFRHYLLSVRVHQTATALFRFIASLGRTMIVANILGSFAGVIILLLGGFLLSQQGIKGWWIWGYRISPLMHGQNAISVNEFLGHSWKKPAVSDGTLVEKCCHFSDLMNLIIEVNLVRVIASGSHNVNHKDEEYDGKIPDILDNTYEIVEYDNGSRAMLDLCMFVEGSKNEQEVCVVGDIGKGEAFVPENIVRIGTRTGGRAGVQTTEVHDERVKYAGLHHGSSYLEHL